MEVTKDEQRKLDDLFRKIADRDEFVAQQRQAAETLRRKEALLEWAKAVKADPMIPMNIDKVIEKIESL